MAREALRHYLDQVGAQIRWRRARKPLLEELGLPEEENLVTAGMTFDEGNPGQCRLVTRNGSDVYALPELLKERGLYFAERRKDG